MRFSAICVLLAASGSSAFMPAPLATGRATKLQASFVEDALAKFRSQHSEEREVSEGHNEVVDKDFRLMAMVLGSGVALTAAGPLLSAVGSGLATIGIPVVGLAGLFGMRTSSIELELGEHSFGFKGMGKNNRIIGGKNSWDYDKIVNYEFFPKGWIDQPQGPILFYMKEVQTPPEKWNMGPGAIANSPEKLAEGAVPGQIHWMPAMFDAKRLRAEFQKRGVANLQEGHGDHMNNVLVASLEKSLKAQMAAEAKEGIVEQPIHAEEVKPVMQSAVVAEPAVVTEPAVVAQADGIKALEERLMHLERLLEKAIAAEALSPKAAPTAPAEETQHAHSAKAYRAPAGLQELEETIETQIVADNAAKSAKKKKTETTTLHILNYPKMGSCGQMEVPKNVSFLAKMLGGYLDGECSLDGFYEEQGTMTGNKKQDADKVYTIYGR